MSLTADEFDESFSFNIISNPSNGTVNLEDLKQHTLRIGIGMERILLPLKLRMIERQELMLLSTWLLTL